MSSARIAYLLNVRKRLCEDLARAQSADEAAAHRATLRGIDHSLWLAGYDNDDNELNEALGRFA